MLAMHALVTLMVLAAGPVAPPAKPPPEAPPVRENAPLRVERPEQPKKGKHFVQRRLARPSPGEATPLVFSLTERPGLLGPDTRTFEFEPGVPARSSWPNASTAWLVREGAVTSGRSLFGSFTVTDGVRAENGFAALAPLDLDGDGVVSVSEAATLRLWFDVDGDRHVGPDELKPVDFALPTTFTVRESCNPRGDCVRERAQAGAGWLLDLHLRLDVASPLVSLR